MTLFLLFLRLNTAVAPTGLAAKGLNLGLYGKVVGLAFGGPVERQPKLSGHVYIARIVAAFKLPPLDPESVY